VRAKYAKELEDPEVKRLLAASTAAEVGGQGPQAEQAYIESVLNRAAARGMTLRDTLTSEYDPRTKKGYYPHSTIAKLGRRIGPEEQARINSLLGQVMAGSNLSNFATGNESGGVRSGGAPIVYRSPRGERFVQENADRAWIRSMQQRAREGGQGPQATTPDSGTRIPLSGGARERGAASWENLDPEFRARLSAMYDAAPPDVKRQLSVMSGWRSLETQARLYRGGRPGMVARPTPNAPHVRGEAADLSGYGGPRGWVHQHAHEFGLRFPMSYEPWHIQLDPRYGGRGGRGGRGRRAALDETQIPAAAQYVAGGPGPQQHQLDYLAWLNRNRVERGLKPWTYEQLMQTGGAPKPEEVQNLIANDLRTSGGLAEAAGYGSVGVFPEPLQRAPGPHRIEMNPMPGGAVVDMLQRVRVNKRNWDRFLRAQKPSTNIEDRRGEPFVEGDPNASVDDNWLLSHAPPEELDRSSLYGAMGREITSRVEGTGKLTVDVTAPRGTQVGAEAGGLFKKLEINRQTQMADAVTGPPEPVGQTGGDWFGR